MSENLSTELPGRPKIDVVAKMLSDIQNNGKTFSLAPGMTRQPDTEQTVVCVFDFEPRLRFLPYIIEFNRVLNEYTEFNFDIYSIRSGCIDVCYYAKDFSSTEKNTVRRQITQLIREHDVAISYHISHFVLFGKPLSGLASDHAGK